MSIKKGKKKKKGNEAMGNKKEEGRRGRRVKGEGREKARGDRNKEINRKEDAQLAWLDL